MLRKVACRAEVAVNAKGEILVAYADPALDAVEALVFDAASLTLSVRVRSGMVDARTVGLGAVPAGIAERLKFASEAIFAREDDQGTLHSGIVAVEKAQGKGSGNEQPHQ